MLILLTLIHPLTVPRQVYPGQDVAVSLFLTASEIWSLASHFSAEQRQGQEEMVIYSAAGAGPGQTRPAPDTAETELAGSGDHEQSGELGD